MSWIQPLAASSEPTEMTIDSTGPLVLPLVVGERGEVFDSESADCESSRAGRDTAMLPTARDKELDEVAASAECSSLGLRARTKIPLAIFTTVMARPFVSTEALPRAALPAPTDPLLMWAARLVKGTLAKGGRAAGLANAALKASLGGGAEQSWKGLGPCSAEGSAKQCRWPPVVSTKPPDTIGVVGGIKEEKSKAWALAAAVAADPCIWLPPFAFVATAVSSSTCMLALQLTDLPTLPRSTHNRTDPHRRTPASTADFAAAASALAAAFSANVNFFGGSEAATSADESGDDGDGEDEKACCAGGVYGKGSGSGELSSVSAAALHCDSAMSKHPHTASSALATAQRPPLLSSLAASASNASAANVKAASNLRRHSVGVETGAWSGKRGEGGGACCCCCLLLSRVMRRSTSRDDTDAPTRAPDDDEWLSLSVSALFSPASNALASAAHPSISAPAEAAAVS
mmetsp:Transcript_51773/g.88848  ORF Transcript_51773/g.88848 Transcript_51773/m.88848 type:complete len:460 (-) Transcript_51773:342-1721(-)